MFDEIFNVRAICTSGCRPQFVNLQSHVVGCGALNAFYTAEQIEASAAKPSTCLRKLLPVEKNVADHAFKHDFAKSATGRRSNNTRKPFQCKHGSIAFPRLKSRNSRRRVPTPILVKRLVYNSHSPDTGKHGKYPHQILSKLHAGKRHSAFKQKLALPQESATGSINRQFPQFAGREHPVLRKRLYVMRKSPVMIDVFHRTMREAAIVEHYSVQIVAQGDNSRRRGHPRMQPVVPVDECHISAPCLFQTQIPRRRHPAVFNMPYVDAVVYPGIEIEDLAAVVDGTVVNTDDLEVLQRLAAQRLERGGDILLHVVHRYYERNHWLDALEKRRRNGREPRLRHVETRQIARFRPVQQFKHSPLHPLATFAANQVCVVKCIRLAQYASNRIADGILYRRSQKALDEPHHVPVQHTEQVAAIFPQKKLRHEFIHLHGVRDGACSRVSHLPGHDSI